MGRFGGSGGGGVLYLLLLGHDRNHALGVGFRNTVRSDDDRVVLSTMCGQWRRDAVATTGVFGRRAVGRKAGSLLRLHGPTVPALSLVTAGCNWLGHGGRVLMVDEMRCYGPGWLLREVARWRRCLHGLSGLPLALDRSVGGRYIQSGEILVQASVGVMVRARRMGIDHHRAGLLASCNRGSMVEALDAR